MTLCTDWSLVQYRAGSLTAIPLYCNCWSCDTCSGRRKARLIAEAASGAPTKLLTLTVSPRSGPTPDARARALRDAWRVLRRRIARKHGGKAPPFMAVFEKTKRGEPHLHILLRGPWLDQRWLSAAMNDLISAPIVDIRAIDQARSVAGYVAKYIGKDPTPFDGCKRYWRSLDYLDAREPDPAYDAEAREDWNVVEMPLGQVNFWCQAAGWTVTFDDDGLRAAGPGPPPDLSALHRGPDKW